MARSGGNNILGFFAVGVVTIAAGAALGYYVIGGDRAGNAPPSVTGIQESAPPAPPSTPRVVSAPPRVSLVQPNANYTAPGAPRIHIVEDQSLTLGASRPAVSDHRSDNAPPANIPTPDVEASQEAAGNSEASSDASSTPNSITMDDSASSAPANASEDATPSSSAPSSSATSPAQTQSDSESSQSGVPNQVTPDDRSQSSTHIQYRLQAAGVFSTQQGAQAYADSLSGKGVPASVSSHREGGQTVYSVQVGAYRDHGDAKQAASNLQRQGVPVTVNPATP